MDDILPFDSGVTSNCDSVVTAHAQRAVGSGCEAVAVDDASHPAVTAKLDGAAGDPERIEEVPMCPRTFNE